LASNKLKINIFGELWSFKKFDFSKEELELYTAICHKLKMPIHKAVLDPFFYHFLGNNSISNYEDLKGMTLKGLLNSPKNQIEIWFKNKKVQKLTMSTFNNEYLLFPLYKSETIEITSKLEEGIYVEQKEFGFISSYEFILEDEFNIENLCFHLINFDNKQILNRFTYTNKKPIGIKKEPLISYQNGFII
jgi:hypothetical protein